MHNSKTYIMPITKQKKVEPTLEKGLLVVPTKIQIDHNFSRYFNDFIQDIGPLHHHCRDIILYFASEGKNINATLFHKFQWTASEFVQKFDKSRSKLQRDYSQVLTEENINFLKLKYGDWTKKEHYDWVKTVLDLCIYVLQNAKLTYGLRNGNKFTIQTYSIITDSIIEYSETKKVYSCNVDEGFIDRCINSYYNSLLDYPLVPEKFRNIHLYLSHIKEQSYYFGENTNILNFDKIAGICGAGLDQEPRFLKKFINNKLADYLNATGFRKVFDDFTWVKGNNTEFLYSLKVQFGIDKDLDKRVFNYRKNENFEREYYKTTLVVLFDKVNEHRKLNNRFTYDFNSWYSDEQAEGTKQKHDLFIKCFKKIYNKDISSYASLLQKEFGYIPKLS